MRQPEALVLTLLEPVLHDIDVTEAIRPQLSVDIKDGTAQITLGSRGISSYGFDVELYRPPGQLLAELAERVQDWVIEERWSSGSNWPACPAHPASHPLEAALSEDVAVWRCPFDAAVSIPIGEL